MNALDFKETQFKPFWNHILAILDELKTKDFNTNQRITQVQTFIEDMYLKQNEENKNAIQLLRDEMIKQNQKITKDIEDNKSLNLKTFDQYLQQINKLNNEFDESKSEFNEFKTLQNKLILDQDKSISQLKMSWDKVELNVDELSKNFNAHSSNSEQKLTLISNDTKELRKIQKENKDAISAWSN